ncbi:MAG: hypothetical protein JW778_00685 [Candidatus Altiarchaeota archaeon]|nr:hypothetical protein [Candidatus Altiarchaeota archaeon]
MKPKNIIHELAIIYLLINSVSAVSVGTAPGVYDLGELDAGTNVAFRFYLMTNAQNDMLVTLSYIPVHQDMYYQAVTSGYRFIPKEASQEDITSWVEIPRNPLLLSPERVQVVYLQGGGVVRANEEADIVLHIPENADPGYHAGSISLSPQVASGGRGTGVMTIAVTRFIFVFRIAGEAKRDGEIMTILGERLEEKKAKIDVLFKNTGTCTLSARVTELKLYDKFGEHVATLQSGIKIVRPAIIESLTAYWQGEAVKPGTYRVEAKVDYITGYKTAEATVEIPTTIKVKPKKPTIPLPEVSVCGYLPYLLMVLIIAALLIYWLDWRRKETALLIIAALFLIAIAFYVLTCVISLSLGFSWLDILLVIIIIALIIYWRLS